MGRRRLRRANLRRGLAILLILALGLWLDRAVAGALLAFAEKQAHAEAVAAIDRAVQRMAASVRYDQLVAIQRDPRGRVTLIQLDTPRLARLVSSLQQEVQSELIRLHGQSVAIPLGMLLGVDVLAAYGPRVQVALIPLGDVSVRVDQRFEQAGINQTRHRVYAQVEARMRLVVPLHGQVATVRTSLPLVDTVIVGEVPQWVAPLPWPR